MGLIGKFTGTDINKGVEEWRNTEGAILLDVRTREEYAHGHIEGSVNIPLDEIERVDKTIGDKNVVLYVHCLSGARSSSAVRYLKAHGYLSVKNIGGINGYKGELK